MCLGSGRGALKGRRVLDDQICMYLMSVNIYIEDRERILQSEDCKVTKSIPQKDSVQVRVIHAI
jgi:hypothetical protein